ncbi:MAG TPA: HIT domain-containing protein [Candidatus Angelobacter sp.]|nr:HIT domain-containing protein [Candidatus Angelobacter sp.]
MGKSSDGFATLFGSSAATLEVLAHKDDVSLILDVAPVRPGHLLLVTRSHQRSFVTLWKNKADSVNIILSAVLESLRARTGLSAIVCEHGLGLQSKGQAGCVEHAHIHVIPADRPFISMFRQAGVGLEPIQDFQQILECASEQQYLYLQDADGVRYSAVSTRFPSQLVRRLVAQKYGQIFWSWRDYLDFADMVGTRKTILEGREIYKDIPNHLVFMTSS